MRRLTPLVFFPFWLVLFQEAGLLSSWFHLVDEHLVPELVADLAVLDARATEVMHKWVAMDLGERRFRPLYYATRVLRAELFGLDWGAWVTTNALAAAVTGAVLFVLGRLLRLTVILSLGFVAMSMLGRPATVWWRLGTPETEGNLLMSLTLALITVAVARPQQRGRYELAALLLAVLASLTKEAVILLLPAVAALRVWLPCWLHGSTLRSALGDARPFTIALGCVAIAELAVLLLTVGTAGTGYAGVDAASFDTRRLWTGIRAVSAVSGLQLSAIASLLLFASCRAAWGRTGRPREIPLLMFWLVFLVAALPQVLLYSKSGWVDHYFNPLTVFGALLMMLSVDSLRPINRWLYLLFLALVLLQINTRFHWTKQQARDYAADGAALRSLLESTRSCGRSAESLLLVANPQVHYEEAFSLRTFLTMDSARKSVYLATVGGSGAQILSDALADQEQRRAFLSAQILEEYYFRGQTLPRLLRNVSEPPGAILILAPESLGGPFLHATSGWLRPDRYGQTAHQVAGIRMRLMCLIR